jgi:VIT1/CCC1 family predicted Fe2+/Mn2+ transporter
MEVKTHESSAEMRGDERRVLDALVIALASVGFRVERRAAGEVEFVGLTALGAHHIALVGASRIVARASNRRLVLEAELGGVEQMRRFLTVFPLWLGVMFGTIFGVLLPTVFRQKFEERGWILLAPVLLMVVVLFLIGLVFGRLAMKKFEARTRAALDALTISVASIGADG